MLLVAKWPKRRQYRHHCRSCIVENTTKLGDGICDRTGNYNTPECDDDGGDCKNLNLYPDCGIPASESAKLGDGVCDGGLFFTEECGFDHGDCANCKVDNPSLIGDGECDGGDYNTEECGWDGGDCIEFNEKYPRLQG